MREPQTLDLPRPRVQHPRMVDAGSSGAFMKSFEELRGSLPDLPQEEPSLVQPLAGVTLRARLQRRDIREEAMELSEAVAKRMPAESVPPPPPDWGRSTRVVRGPITGRRACTLCGVRPGFGPCPRCVGTGRVDGGNDCPECDEGWVPCTTCDGSGQVLLTTIRHVDDRDVTINHTFLPVTTRALEEVLLASFLEEEPDESLRFELELRNDAGGPYREVAADPQGGSFHGHTFVEAIARARGAVAQIAGAHWVREEVRAYARPFLWVRWHSVDGPARNAAITTNNGVVRLFRAY